MQKVHTMPHPQKLQTGPAMAGLIRLTPTALHIHTHMYAVESNVCSLASPLLNS